jgi:hypothetical protein
LRPFVGYVLLLGVMLHGTARARPVSFLNSTMVMFNGQSMTSGLTIARTISRRFAFGLTYQWLDRGKDRLNLLAQEVSVLAFRHNALDWQANGFATVGLGGLKSTEEEVRELAMVSFEADAESRRWYLAASARYIVSRARFEDLQTTLRAGWAPVLGEFDRLNPWVVLQYQYMRQFRNRHILTPMVRLLYQNVAVELGMSLRGEASINFSAEL